MLLIYFFYCIIIAVWLFLLSAFIVGRRGMEIDSVPSGEILSPKDGSNPSILNKDVLIPSNDLLKSKIVALQKEIGKPVAGIPEIDLMACIELIETNNIDVSCYESLRYLCKYLTCPNCDCNEALKKSRGAEGRQLTTLTFTCPQHGKIQATKLITSLPDKVFLSLFEKFGIDGTLAFIKNFVEINQQVIMKANLFEEQHQPTQRMTKQTSIMDFANKESNDSAEVMNAKTTLIENEPTNQGSEVIKNFQSSME